MSDQYPTDGTIEDVEAWVEADPGDENRAALAVAYEQEHAHPRKGIIEKYGDEPNAIMTAEEGGAVPVQTATGARLLALRGSADPDAPEVGLPVGGVVAVEDVYAEIVLPGTVTPTFQLLAKAGVVVNEGDLVALPPRG